PRKFRLRKSRGTDFAVEIDEREVSNLRERSKKFDGGAARKRDVALHALAGIEQQTDVERDLGFSAARTEIGDLLRLAVFADFEVLRAEIADAGAGVVGDGDRKTDQIDARPEGGLRAR